MARSGRTVLVQAGRWTMKLLAILGGAGSILIVTAPAFSQQADPGWYGQWNMVSEKPGPGAPPAAKMARVVMGERGWAYAGLDSDGALEAGALAIGPNNGCTPVGHPAEYTCPTQVLD